MTLVGRYGLPGVRVWGALASCAASASAAMGQAPELARLVSAYPQQLERIEGNLLVWRDGTRMVIDEGKAGDEGRMGRDHETLLATADIKDSVATPYPIGRNGLPPGRNIDPGRARNVALFDKMYGSCLKGETARHLVDVAWLPGKGGGRVRVTTINGVHEKVAAVSQQLDALPASFDRFLVPSAGAFACRPIAGTNRVSAHGYGIAIDVATATTDYWLWNKGTARGERAGAGIPYKNRVPIEIVEIFERHGFIWGGKWYHYDTMHFEYRPELIGR